MRAAQIPVKAALEQLLYSSLPFFMSQLTDPSGKLLEVAPHHRRWAELMAMHRRLLLIAPRSHGKTTTVIAFILWQAWRHGRDPLTGQLLPGSPGRFSVFIFSATHDQAAVVFSSLREMVDANPWLFGSVGTSGAAGQGRRRTRFSERYIRLANGAEISRRAFGTSVRGLHPDVLVLDDVLNDTNSLRERGRGQVWKYFSGTLLPMDSGRIVIVGSAIHQDDLLHCLAPGHDGSLVQGFEWRRFPAIDEETGTSLWPSRHSYAELAAFRDAEPSIFSREYQGEPRDDVASLFPYELTGRAVAAGRDLTFVPYYDREPNELVMLGADFALSAAAGADFTVILVVAWNLRTGRRRLLAAERRKGLDIGDQADLLVALCRRFRVNVGIVENNGFQRWLVDHLERWPDVRSNIHGHTTGREKADPVDGVIGIKLKLRDGLWVIPSGDDESRRFARTWQAEMGAFGWTDGHLQGLGEHDDTVMATWFVELAIKHTTEVLAYEPRVELVDLDDLGIERYHIGEPYDLEEYLDRLGYDGPPVPNGPSPR